MKADKVIIDAFNEIVNIGIGKSANILNTMLQSHITLKVPNILLLKPNAFYEFEKYRTETFASVDMEFQGQFSGYTSLSFPQDSAIQLTRALAGDFIYDDDLNSIVEGTLNEIGNIIINALIGSIGNILNLEFRYDFPTYNEGASRHLFEKYRTEDDTSMIVLINTNFNVEDLSVEGRLSIFLEMGSFDKLKNALFSYIGLD